MPLFVYVVAPSQSLSFVRVRVETGDGGGGCVADVVDAVSSQFSIKTHHINLGLVSAGGPQPSPSAVAAAVKKAETAPLDISLDLGEAAGFAGGAWLVVSLTHSFISSPNPSAEACGLSEGGGGTLSPRERFRSLLAGAGTVIEGQVMSIIARSAALSSRMLAVSSVDDACALYQAAAAIPRTLTRVLLKQRGIIMDGEMVVPGAQTALFFHAFKGRVPHVLKVPSGRAGDGAARECALYAELSRHDIPPGVFLVPVERLDLSAGSFHEALSLPGQPSEVTSLKTGILMPAYAGTLSRFLPPMSTSIALDAVRRLAPTLHFLHSSGWLHGDVKPDNIFVDYLGDLWLGDYGTSVPLAGCEDIYTGGTPAFQCYDIALGSRFDLAGLAISILVQLGLLKLGEAGFAGWPLAALQAALARVEDGPLHKELAALLSE